MQPSWKENADAEFALRMESEAQPVANEFDRSIQRRVARDVEQTEAARRSFVVPIMFLSLLLTVVAVGAWVLS